jgi:cation:H+ antiporter
LTAVLSLAAGVAALAVATDHFVVGASRLSRLLGVPAVIVGIVLIGFGTSLPELLVSGMAAAGGEPTAALGNVAGSNIANLSLLLGVAAVLAPIAVPSSAVTREVPLALAAALALVVVVPDGLGVAEGVALIAAMLAVVGWLLRAAHRSRNDPFGAETDELVGSATGHAMGTELARALLGLVGTVIGSHLLVDGALEIARTLGIAAGVVGVTLLALGTSLPELVTVIQAARRHEPDLIVGNLLGSNLFNSLMVAGAVGALGGTPPDGDVTVAVLAGLALTVLAGIALTTGRRVTRAEGLVLCALYGAAVVLIL